jgi:hypothetical protein
LGLSIWEAVEIRDPALLPDMKELFDLGYVCTGICGEYEDIERDIQKPARDQEKKELLNIFDRYNRVITTWAGYKEEKEDLTDEKEGLIVKTNGNGRHSRLCADILISHGLKRPIFTWGSRNLSKKGFSEINTWKLFMPQMTETINC